MNKKEFEEMIKDEESFKKELYQDIIDNEIHEDPLVCLAPHCMNTIDTIHTSIVKSALEMVNEGMTEEQKKSLALNPESVKLFKDSTDAVKFVQSKEYNDKIKKIGDIGGMVLLLLHNYPHVKEELDKRGVKQGKKNWFHDFKEVVLTSLMQSILAYAREKFGKDKDDSV